MYHLFQLMQLPKTLEPVLKQSYEQYHAQAPQATERLIHDVQPLITVAQEASSHVEHLLRHFIHFF